MKWGRTRTRNEQAHKQQGSIIVPAAAALLVGLVLLGAAHLGHNFHVKRGLQNAADLAALAGAQALGSGDALGCQQGESMARFSLSSQPDSPAAGLTGDGAKVLCGKWNSSHSDPAQRFVSALPADSVRVHLSYQPPSLFPFFTSSRLEAVATAKSSQPVAAFSVGSRLVSLGKKGLVYNLLRGVGVDAETLHLLDSAGLAEATITPAGLLKQLGLPISILAGIGTPEQLARVDRLTVADIVDASLSLISIGSTADADLSLLLNKLKNNGSSSLRVLLEAGFKLLGNGGLLNIGDGSDILSAADVDLKIASLLGTALVVANGENAIGLDVNLLPLGGLSSVIVKLSVVEPPTIAIGGVGVAARSAGVRLDVRAKLLKLEIPLVANVGLDLPVVVNVSQSTGVLKDICPMENPRERVFIEVTNTPVMICIGKYSFNNSKSTCDEVSAVDVKLILGLIPLVKLKVMSKVEDENPAGSAWLGFGEGYDSAITIGGKLRLADTIAKALTDLRMKPSVIGIPLPLDVIVNALGSILKPVSGSLDIVLQTALDLLGLQIVEADVELMSVNCNELAYLVQ
ncbi:pilus assembly protein TadG-related protein [Alcaligenes faecalis]|uniref:pilus assembly protein TadG-related protein n=1 Tax=Alcaligenes faecalis TaxID=511 RepID=UPI002AA7612C|nr:pilus assembly protein TadG-related protein [Alcaligenes faecalis]